jgi:NADPH-dependent curcumin reductase
MGAPMKNRQVLLRSRPQGIPQAEHFEIVEAPVPEPREGQVLVRNLFLSVEPAMRGWVNAAANYSEPVAVGAVMRAITAGRVERSCHADWKAGDLLTGMFGWQDYCAVDAATIGPATFGRRVTETDLPLSAALGVLGLNGLTAYFALLDVGLPRAGDTVVVSTAAGSVGSAVGQIARLSGCRTVGIAGGPVKVRQCVEEFGFDAAVDYKSEGWPDRLRAACPNGVDVYFDNTAGSISDAVHPLLATAARVVICGTASVPSWDPIPSGPRLERHLLVKRARVQGFVVFDYAHRYPEGLRRLADWVRAGRLVHREDILDGIECAPDSIAGLYRGENLGKRVIRLAE